MKDIIFNPLLKLSNVNRYSGVYLLKSENVSDHTCQVGLMSIIIANEINNRISEDFNAKLELKTAHISMPKFVDLKELAFKALVHDIDEASSADIPRNVKYSNPDILKQFKLLEENAVKNVSEQFNFPELFQVWNSAKDNSLEGRIVKLSDLLTVIRKTVDEVVILGNKNMLRVAVEVIDQVKQEKQKILLDKTLDSVILNFFCEIYESASNILQEIIDNNMSEISDFYFKSKT